MFARRFFENIPLVKGLPLLQPTSFSVDEMKALLAPMKIPAKAVDDAFEFKNIDAWGREDTSETVVDKKIKLGSGYALDLRAKFQPHTDIWGRDIFDPNEVVAQRPASVYFSIHPMIDADIADRYQPENDASLIFSVDRYSQKFVAKQIQAGRNYSLSDPNSAQAFLQVFGDAVAFASARKNKNYNRGLDLQTNISGIQESINSRPCAVPPLRRVTWKINNAVRDAQKEIHSRKKNGVSLATSTSAPA